MTSLTKGKVLANGVVALLKARSPLIWVVTSEEARVERHLFDAAAAAKYVPYTWDCGQGVANIGGDIQDETYGSADIGDTLGKIRDRSKAKISSTDTNRAVWVLRDAGEWLQGPGGMQTKRQLRNLVRTLPGAPKNTAQAVIVISTSADVPAELKDDTVVVEWALPDRQEIGEIIDRAIRSLPETLRNDAAPNGAREAAIDAAVGLTEAQAAACYAKSLVQTRKIDASLVSTEKRSVISKLKALEWTDVPAGGLSDVGGLDVLKSWVEQRKAAYSKEARDYGLKAPKGVFLVGVQGCGKSLSVKGIASCLGMPIIRLDLGALKAKFVGDSEANIRNAFQVIDSVGRCVVWLDEIEKALQGAVDGGADGGVSGDALGTFLTWMQERKGEAFVVATSNDISKIPPEVYRKGRFDEVFFVDLPNYAERMEILSITIKLAGRDAKALKINLGEVAKVSDTFTGSEVAELVNESLFTAFSDGGREITTRDLVAAAKSVVPLAKTAEQKIKTLRDWANGRARFATSKGKSNSEVTEFVGPDLDL